MKFYGWREIKSWKIACIYIGHICFFASVFALVASFIPQVNVPLWAILKTTGILWLFYTLFVALVLLFKGLKKA